MDLTPVYAGLTKQRLSLRLYQHNYGQKGLGYYKSNFNLL